MGKHGSGRRDEEWEITGPTRSGEFFAPDDEEQDEGPGSSMRGAPRRVLSGWGYRGLVVVLVLVAAVVGFRVAAAVRPSEDGELLVKTSRTQDPASAQDAASTARGRPAPTASGTPAASPASGTAGPGQGEGPAMLDPAVVKVHVVGAVRRPGLYRLAAGARIDDAVEAAGGAAKGADLGGVNLAAPVADGTQIRVPARGEEPVPGDRATPAPGGSGLLPTGPATAQGSDGGTVNLNTADATTLQTLPGIGPALSQRLIEWREQQGPFTSSADLDAVPGIGPAMLAKLEGKVGYG